MRKSILETLQIEPLEISSQKREYQYLLRVGYQQVRILASRVWSRVRELGTVAQ